VNQPSPSVSLTEEEKEKKEQKEVSLRCSGSQSPPLELKIIWSVATGYNNLFVCLVDGGAAVWFSCV
jgi:hypothetical protein